MRPISDHAEETVLRSFLPVQLNQVLQSDMCLGMDHSVYSTIAIETIQNRDCIVVRGAHEHQSMCLYGLSTHHRAPTLCRSCEFLTIHGDVEPSITEGTRHGSIARAYARIAKCLADRCGQSSVCVFEPGCRALRPPKHKRQVNDAGPLRHQIAAGGPQMNRPANVGGLRTCAGETGKPAQP